MVGHVYHHLPLEAIVAEGGEPHLLLLTRRRDRCLRKGDAAEKVFSTG